jgi:NADH-quinone oxidoreductase subunit M
MQRMPVWSVFMVLFAMASLALPGLNGFVSEFLCLLGIFTADRGTGTGFPGVLGPAYAVLAGLALVLGALYILRMLQKFVFGPLREPAQHGNDHHAGNHGHHGHHGAGIRDLNGREVLSMLPLAAGCVVIGLWPQPILDAIKPVARDVVAPYTALIERSQRDGAATAAALAPAAGTDAAATTGGMQ